MNIGLFMQAIVASFIFFPSRDFHLLPEQIGLTYESVELKTSDNVRLSAWYFPEKSEKGVIYLIHGNAGNIGDRLFKVPAWLGRGYSVFLLDYRGYGRSEGKLTSERDLYVDAEAGLQWLREKKGYLDPDIILNGESIGCAGAIELATKSNFGGLLLEAPFTSLPQIAKIHYPFIPSVFVSAFQFDNAGKISKVHTPVFIWHGERDSICPFRMGESLYEKASQPKEFFGMPGGDHNNLVDTAGAEFYDRAVNFMERARASSNQMVSKQ